MHQVKRKYIGIHGNGDNLAIYQKRWLWNTSNWTSYQQRIIITFILNKGEHIALGFYSLDQHLSSLTFLAYFVAYKQKWVVMETWP